MFDVSIIIPCYLQHSYVLNAVNSCLQQTVLPKEIIIILMDNESKNLKKYLLNLSNKIQCFETDQMFLPKARNFGIKQSSSKYILPLDADDWIEPFFIEKISKHSQDAEIIYTDYIVYKHDTDYTRKEVPNVVLKASFLGKKHPFILATTLFTKNVWQKVGGYNEDFIYGFENWEFFYRSYIFNKKFIKCSNTFFYYRHGDNNINAKRAESYKQLIEQQFKDFYPQDFETKENKNKQNLIRQNFTLEV